LGDGKREGSEKFKGSVGVEGIDSVGELWEKLLCFVRLATRKV
jgi:hypothetical protein